MKLKEELKDGVIHFYPDDDEINAEGIGETDNDIEEDEDQKELQTSAG